MLMIFEVMLCCLSGSKEISLIKAQCFLCSLSQKINSLLGLTALSGFICLITVCVLILLLPVYDYFKKKYLQ